LKYVENLIPVEISFSVADSRPLIRAFKVETGISKGRAAAAAEGYLPFCIACMANERRPSCSIKFPFLSERLGGGEGESGGAGRALLLWHYPLSMVRSSEEVVPDASGLTTVHRTQSQSHGDPSRALSDVSRDRERQRVGYFPQCLRSAYGAASVLPWFWFAHWRKSLGPRV
jgi:hypothetical protein